MITDRIESLHARHNGPIPLANAKLSAPNAKWRVVSAIQKAVRRGNVSQGHLTMSALLNSGELDYILRRLCVIALEDVAFGDMELCADVFAYCGYKNVRDQTPPDMLLHLVRDLCETKVKDRSPCELSVQTGYTPNTLETRLQIIQKLPEQNFEITRSDTNPVLRVLSGWCLGGMLDNGLTGKEKRYGERHTAMWHEAQSDLPELMQFISKKALSFGGEVVGLATAMRVVWECENNSYPVLELIETQPEPPAPLVNGLASVAYDMHCFEGKKAYGYFAKACKPIAQWFEENPHDKPLGMLGDAIFEVEGKWCRGRTYSMWGSKTSKQSRVSESQTWGVTYDKFRELGGVILANMDDLNHARVRIMEK